MKPKLECSCDDPKAVGALGGIKRFAKAHGITQRKAKSILERNLTYSLHKPVRRRFKTLPVLVFNIDQQWVANLVEMQRVSRYNN